MSARPRSLTTPPAPLRRDSPIRFLPGVGPRRAERLSAAGFSSVGDLLFHLPLRYEDRRRIVDPGEIREEGRATIAGHLTELRLVRTRRRGFVIVRGRLAGERGLIPVRWFNQPFLLQRFADGDAVVATGEVRGSGLGLFELVNPTLVRAEAAGGGIVPVYPAIGGFGPNATATLVARATEVAAVDPPDEPLPDELRARYRLPELARALALLHAPPADSELAPFDARETPAHLRLIYGELLGQQLQLALARSEERAERKPHAYRIDDRARGVVRELLPFALTAAQKRAVREIVDDLRSPWPMLRLLQGDVGSGKTIVAAIALALAVESGLQAAYMAPTELLAEQQYGALRRLFPERVRIELVSSTASSAAVRRALAAGEIDVAVGTHALIQRRVEFARLALVVIDEQHRFGVEQRRQLEAKGTNPDLLVMTATPIPRSLALTAYGDLDQSILDELPPGRTPIRTEVLPAGRRGEIYARVRAELERGGRAYVVFPLIEQSEEVDAASVEAFAERVRAALRGFAVGVLHGRLGAEERERLVRGFARGELVVLVATTVVEVGVDVPEATFMLIESAERFGLAQLHQLRGRVGRGARASTCVALHGRLSELARRRLDLFASARDGFEIAEADLELRGPGDLLGRRQAGLPGFRLADPVRHREWIERARADAREIVARGDEPAMKRVLDDARRHAPERRRAFAGG